MKLKTISTTYGRKMNLGDYNSAHVEISLWADLEDGDDAASATDALRIMARNNVMRELGRFSQQLEAATKKLFMGLPVDVRNDLEVE